MPWAFEMLAPEAIALLNLSRDQLSRLNETRMISQRWRECVTAHPEITVVANADDPLVVWAAQPAGEGALGRGRPTLDRGRDRVPRVPVGDRVRRRRGLGLHRMRLRPPETRRRARRRPARASRRHRALRSRLRCPASATAPTSPWRRSRPRCSVSTLHAAVAAAVARDGSPAGTAPSTSAARRYGCSSPRTPRAGRRPLRFIPPPPRPVVLVLNARDPDGHDPSWIWDVPFEELGDRPVICTGDRGSDLSVRLTLRGHRARVATRRRSRDRSARLARRRRHRELQRVPRPPPEVRTCLLTFRRRDRARPPGPARNLRRSRQRHRARGASAPARHRRARARSRSWSRCPIDADIYLLGGGEDGAQSSVAADAQLRGALHTAVERGAVVLGVCAGFQLLGRSFETGTGETRRGFGVLDCRSARRDGRARGRRGAVATAAASSTFRRSPASRTTAAEPGSARISSPLGRARARRRQRRRRGNRGRDLRTGSSAPTCTVRCSRATPCSPTSSSRGSSAPARAVRRCRRSTACARSGSPRCAGRAGTRTRAALAAELRASISPTSTSSRTDFRTTCSSGIARLRPSTGTSRPRTPPTVRASGRSRPTRKRWP